MLAEKSKETREKIFKWHESSLAWPDPLRTGAYRLEIISAALRGSGILHSIQIF